MEIASSSTFSRRRNETGPFCRFGMKRSHVVKIIVLVVLLNLVQISYFLLRKLPVRVDSQIHTSYYTSKNWTIVPSNAAWTGSSIQEVAPYSCEGYFGNGFSRLVQVLQDQGGGSFRCHHSETLRTSVCEGRKIVMHPERIDMSIGGEEIDQVKGRNEDDELPTFKDGAFEVLVSSRKAGTPLSMSLDAIMPRGQVHRHTLRSLLESFRTVSSHEVQCSKVISTPTLFVTRFEYANLFHTVTDWYSSYASSRVVGLEHRPAVVLLDGHCQSPMDDGWQAFFSDVKYAKHFKDESICFEHAIFVPLGYDTTLFKCLTNGLPCYGSSPGNLDPKKTARLREFGEQFSSSFIPSLTSLPDPETELQVLFIRREDYLAHPRHTGKPETRLKNEAELYSALVDWAEKQRVTTRKVINNGLFAHMKLEEQVRAVKNAAVIVGVHGAGLTHIVFARPETVVLEILSPLFMRPHYQYISQWMGISYNSIIMDDLTVDCKQVIDKLNQLIETRQN